MEGGKASQQANWEGKELEANSSKPHFKIEEI